MIGGRNRLDRKTTNMPARFFSFSPMMENAP